MLGCVEHVVVGDQVADRRTQTSSSMKSAAFERTSYTMLPDQLDVRNSAELQAVTVPVVTRPAATVGAAAV